MKNRLESCSERHILQLSFLYYPQGTFWPFRFFPIRLSKWDVSLRPYFSFGHDMIVFLENTNFCKISYSSALVHRNGWLSLSSTLVVRMFSLREIMILVLRCNEQWSVADKYPITLIVCAIQQTNTIASCCNNSIARIVYKNCLILGVLFFKECGQTLWQAHMKPIWIFWTS